MWPERRTTPRSDDQAPTAVGHGSAVVPLNGRLFRSFRRVVAVCQQRLVRGIELGEADLRV